MEDFEWLDGMNVPHMAKLISICSNGRRATIEGVRFDLSHERLNPRDWEPTVFLGIALATLGRSPDFPYIWFPWFGNFDEKALRREIEAELEGSVQIRGLDLKLSLPRGRKRRLSEEFVAEQCRNYTPECIVGHGDKIFINRVTSVSAGDEFDHPHDREIRFAHLGVSRKDGSITEISTHYTFVGRASILVPDVARDHLKAVCDRICYHFGLKSINQNVKVSDEHHNKYAYRAYRLAKALAEIVEPARENGQETSGLAGRWIFLGYLWARAEMDLGIRPMVRTYIERDKKGGVKSGETRRKNMEAWQGVARPEILRLYGEHPNYSGTSIAERVRARWAELAKDQSPKKVHAPGFDALRAFVHEVLKKARSPTIEAG